MGYPTVDHRMDNKMVMKWNWVYAGFRDCIDSGTA